MRVPGVFYILVTDINPRIRNFLQREFEKEGYKVSGVTRPTEVFEQIKGADPLDLVILDPEIFYSFDQNVLTNILNSHGALQIVIHTYRDLIDIFPADQNNHLVEKNGQSISKLKDVCRYCQRKSMEKESCR